MIDLADILIGVTALTHNIPIATLNDKHFTRINGLEIIK
jgi:tRNA(fMet)-specific endonuclease VapC